MSMEGESGVRIPCYGDKPEKPGLYLALFHGRSNPRQQMNGWGFRGPLIGPIEWCHITYATYLRVLFESDEDEKRYFADTDFPEAHNIEIVNDLAFYGGAYYGDWTIFVVREEEIVNPEDTFRAVKRRSIRASVDCCIDRQEGC